MYCSTIGAFPFANAIAANTVSNGASQGYDRLHPSVLERIACVFEAADMPADGSFSYKSSETWTSAVVSCALAVEVFIKNDSYDASTVVLTLTQNQILIVAAEGPAVLGHIIPLHVGGLREVHTERITFANKGMRPSEGLGGQQQQPSAGTLHTATLRYQRNPLRGTPMISALLHFPSSSEFDSFMQALKPTMETLYPHHPVVWTDIQSSGEVPTLPSEGADVDVTIKAFSSTTAVPGTLLHRHVLRERAPCTPSDIAVTNTLWSTADRTTALTFGGFYSSSNVGDGYGNDMPSHGQMGTSLASSRANMVGPAVGSAITDDDLRRAKRHLDSVEASVLMSYERLNSDVRGAIGFANEYSLETTKAHHATMKRLLHGEQQRLFKEIVPIEGDVGAAVKVLNNRLKEHNESQVDSYAELSQWNHLEQDCRRIEVQRLQAVKDAQQRNFDAIAEQREENERLNQELKALSDALRMYESASYTSVLSQHDELVEVLKEEDERLKEVTKNLKQLRQSSAIAEKELNSTLAGLRRTIKEATEEGMSAKSKAEMLYAEAATIGQDHVHQQSLVERELERRLEDANRAMDETALQFEEHQLELQALKGKLEATKSASIEVTGGLAAPTNDSSYRNGSVYSTVTSDANVGDFTNDKRGGKDAQRRLFSAPQLATSSGSIVKEVVRGNTNRWDLGFIPKSGRRPASSNGPLCVANRGDARASSTYQSTSAVSHPQSSSRLRVASTSSMSAISDSQAIMGESGLPTTAMRRLASGSMYIAEKAKVEAATESRLRTEHEALKRVTAERRLYSFS